MTVVDPEDGSITFVCNFCGAAVGPVPRGVPVGQVELFHKGDCFYTESLRMSAHSALGRMDN